MDFAASVASVSHVTGNSPDGPIDQYEVIVMIAPSESPNAGLIAPASGNVFSRSLDGTLRMSSASAIQPGDKIEVWHDQTVAYGSASSPPGSPCYTAVQLVIER
jgi:hypothetical protein